MRVVHFYIFTFLFPIVLRASTARIVSLQPTTPDKYQVSCFDGTSELVSGEDIRADKPCGGPSQELPLRNMVSATRLADGKFEVLCSDTRSEIHPPKALQTGEPCFRAGKLIFGTEPYPSSMYVSDENNVKVINNFLYFIPFEVGSPVSISGWGLQTFNFARAVLGVYSSLNGKPHKLIEQSNLIDLTAPNGIHLAPSTGGSMPLPVGKYFLAYTMNRVTQVRTREKKHLVGKLTLPFSDQLPTAIDPSFYATESQEKKPVFFVIAK